MTEQELLAKLKIQVDILHRLLDAPELGAIMWKMAIGERWKNIVDLWNGGKSDSSQK